MMSHGSPACTVTSISAPDPPRRQPGRTDEQRRTVEPGIADDDVAAAARIRRSGRSASTSRMICPISSSVVALDDTPRRPAQPQRRVFSQSGSAHRARSHPRLSTSPIRGGSADLVDSPHDRKRSTIESKDRRAEPPPAALPRDRRTRDENQRDRLHQPGRTAPRRAGRRGGLDRGQEAP